MAIQLINFVVFVIFVISFVSCENECLQRERTWSTDGQIELLAQVSIEQCYDALLKSQDGVALTFFKPDKNNRYENICVIFGSLDGGSTFFTGLLTICNSLFTFPNEFLPWIEIH